MNPDPDPLPNVAGRPDSPQPVPVQAEPTGRYRAYLILEPALDVETIHRKLALVSGRLEEGESIAYRHDGEQFFPLMREGNIGYRVFAFLTVTRTSLQRFEAAIAIEAGILFSLVQPLPDGGFWWPPPSPPEG